MLCGCPVLAGRAGAVEEVCGDAALWFGAARTVAQAVGALVADPALRAGLAEAGRARAARFTWDAAARRLLEACA